MASEISPGMIEIGRGARLNVSSSQAVDAFVRGDQNDGPMIPATNFDPTPVEEAPKGWFGAR